ncbi:ricin-type beta-trefoil lectin domain protein [Actinoplanes sp. NPDC051475]|uniref:ricin-type beta-trefoil lectin domain protein n=1 Tax=Actinoplanes sp. NPDC051475 TaxID=3157225 RepID=UPI00344EA7D9
MMGIRHLLRRRRHITGPHRDDGSMPMAILVSIIAMGLSTAVAPLIVTSITSTQTVGERTESINAANDGLDAAMAQMRAAATAAGAGVLTALPPCEITGAESADGLRYRVKITYYGLPVDPDDESTAKPMSCPPTDVPTRAVVTVTGTGSDGAPLVEGSGDTRTIEATYRFQRNVENVSGGAIRLASPTTDQLCMDSGSDPEPGTGVFLKVCKNGGSSEQRFSYTKDLNIKLMASESVDWPNGLCVDAPTPHKLKAPTAVYFQECLGRQARQQWSLDNGSRFEGTTDGVNMDSYCLNAGTPGTAGPIVIGDCSGDLGTSVFRPDPSAGAGGASSDTGQLVNFKQFSRCLDVTNFKVDSLYMIVWFCKQAPDGNVAWNQQWHIPAAATSKASAKAGQIRTSGTGNPGYCLKRPDVPGGLVTVKACSPSNDDNPPADLAWTVYGDTGYSVLNYSIVDSSGTYCLTPTDLTVANPETHSDGTAKVRTALCTSSHLQKWNAPPTYDRPKALSNTREN